ncbi:hypothetical protein TYRP_009788, partial [Tyrophagus putrescentiae]
RMINKVQFTAWFVLLKNLNQIIASLQQWSRDVQRLGGSHLPVTANVEAIHKDVALCPAVHLQVGVLWVLHSSRMLFDGQLGPLDLPIEDALSVAVTLITAVDAAHVLHQQIIAVHLAGGHLLQFLVKGVGPVVDGVHRFAIGEKNGVILHMTSYLVVAGAVLFVILNAVHNETESLTVVLTNVQQLHWNGFLHLSKPRSVLDEFLQRQDLFNLCRSVGVGQGRRWHFWQMNLGETAAGD